MANKTLLAHWCYSSNFGDALIKKPIDWTDVDLRLIELRKKTDIFFDECGI